MISPLFVPEHVVCACSILYLRVPAHTYISGRIRSNLHAQSLDIERCWLHGGRDLTLGDSRTRRHDHCWKWSSFTEMKTSYEVVPRDDHARH